MTIELPPHQARTLSHLLKSGDYSSPEEILGEGLRLLKARATDRAETLAEVRREVLEGVRQVRARRVRPFDAAAVARIKARGRKLLAATKR